MALPVQDFTELDFKKNENEEIRHFYLTIMIHWSKSCLVFLADDAREEAYGKSQKPPKKNPLIRNSFDQVSEAFFTDYPSLFAPKAKEYLKRRLFRVVQEVYPKTPDEYPDFELFYETPLWRSSWSNPNFRILDFKSRYRRLYVYS